MGLRINTNVASLNSARRLSQTTRDMRGTMEKLSSGERINRSADDAAGLAVSENLRSDIRSLNVAKRNANDGVSLVQTAEGGLMEISSMLTRLRELTVQGASDTIGNEEREFLDKEFINLKDEIDRITNSTEFNGTRLLIGGADLGEDINGKANSFPLEVQVGKDYFSSIDGLDQRNPMNIIKIDFNNINSYTHGEGSLNLGENEDGTRVNTKVAAQESMAILDKAIYKVSEYRAYLGSVQNRLNSSINNLDAQTEYLAEANTRIRDTDFASETARLTQLQILQKAGTSILGNANQLPQAALSLLNG